MNKDWVEEIQMQTNNPQEVEFLWGNLFIDYLQFVVVGQTVVAVADAVEPEMADFDLSQSGYDRSGNRKIVIN